MLKWSRMSNVQINDERIQDTGARYSICVSVQFVCFWGLRKSWMPQIDVYTLFFLFFLSTSKKTRPVYGVTAKFHFFRGVIPLHYYCSGGYFDKMWLANG